MSDGVIVPVVGLAVIYAIAHGWVLTLWQNIWAATNTGLDPATIFKGGGATLDPGGPTPILPWAQPYNPSNPFGRPTA